MRSFINFNLRNKFALLLMTLIVIVGGLYSGLHMKMETIPNINIPLITIVTTDPGATPQQLSDDVTDPLTNAVKNLDGVDTVSSSSSQNASSIQIEYKFNKDMDKALTEVKDAISGVTLPEGVDAPKVSRLSFNEVPVITLSVTGKGIDMDALTKRVENDLSPTLQGLEGVSSVQLSGQQSQEVQLKFKDGKLNKYGLTANTVEQVIQGSNVNLPLGLYTLNGTQKSIVINGNIQSLNDLKNLRIPYTPQLPASMGQANGVSGQSAYPNGAGAANSSQGQMSGTNSQGMGTTTPSQGQTSGTASQGTGTTAVQQGATASQISKLPTVQLKDLADFKVVNKVDSISKTNGKESISLQIVKSPDANTVDVVNTVKNQIKQFKKDYKDVSILSTYDQGQPIVDSVHTMLSKAVFGALFAMIIILIFLRNIRTTLISVVSIPLSILIALLILKQMTITLNLMTLGAMTVAIGRVVDDSIVVIENIYRRIGLEGEELKGRELIRAATQEMFRPIASSTIVTIAVFLPMGFVTGMVGQLFMPFALTIVFSLLSSLLVAVTVVPAMAHSLLGKGLKRVRTDRHEGPNALARFYKSVLNWALNHKWLTSGIAILLLIGSIALVPRIGMSFLPSQEQNMVIETYNPDPSMTLGDVKKVAAKAENYFEGRKGVKTIQYSLGGGGNPMDPTASNQALFYVEYKDNFTNFSHEQEQVLKDLKAQTAKGEWASQDFSSTGSTNQMTVNIYGDTMDQLKPIVSDVEKIMKKQPQLEQVDSSLSNSYQEYRFVANQNKLSQYGLTATQVGMALQKPSDPSTLTTVKLKGKDVKVYVQVKAQNYKDVQDMLNQKVPSATGKDVQVGDVMTTKKGTTADTITKENGQIMVSVSGKVKGNDVSKVSKNVQTALDKLHLPSGASVSMGGVTEDMNDSFSQLGLAMLAAIAIVYLILVITFGGALAPLAILFSLPFTIIGGLTGLWIAGESLSISAMIGALMLIGIVVTNAIVLIDRVIHKEREGLSTREALLEAGVTRLRPILMTAIATIFALLPLALGYENSGFISKGLGITVIGGLASSTLLTLLIVPIVYEALSKLKRRDGSPVS
ncbi:efflux RND transporter permease subunit [Pullulanibacillus sp. KACC 23026]|uniref:efflux RND transporter permease subunit n=1 Tax=Pullulanibacillus sp. KACC 23026 TaxID=3028315 RepID=UPI0023B07EA8|nr:efflux RND transporter permease subunit [Pullulanibacillus sp. KACC 23026]WEG12074.1 efflux RND transporter permease subunit [Pullulanibacillus sp. KACC 23026]